MTGSYALGLEDRYDGNVTQAVDADGRTTASGHGGAGALTSATYPGGHTPATASAGDGNRNRLVDVDFNLTVSAADTCGRLEQTTGRGSRTNL